MQISIHRDIPNVDFASHAAETRRAVGDNAETLGAAATEFGREAMRFGRDAAKLSREAARRGLLLAATSGKALRRASNDAAATIDDLRSYEIVRKRRGPDPRPGIALIAGIGAGVTAMYLLDPEHGKRRRVQLMDQIQKYSRLAVERLKGTAVDARKAMQDRRAQSTDFRPEGVMAGREDGDRAKSPDWSEPQTTPAETYQPT